MRMKRWVRAIRTALMGGIVWGVFGVAWAGSIGMAVPAGDQPALTATAAWDMAHNVPCWDEAAAYHGVDPWLLYAIADVESSLNPSALNRNTNGTVDVGIMQVNTIWFPVLREYGINPGWLQNACAATYIGAWILARNIRTYGYTWQAIAAYHSATPSLGYAYAQKVYAAHRRLILMAQESHR